MSHRTIERITLVEPTTELKAEFLAMLDDIDQAGESYPIHSGARNNFGGYVDSLQGMQRGAGLPHGIVPMSSYWLVRGDGILVGESRLRHALTPRLEKEGGHIGYLIRPSFRKLGYGTRILALTLEKAREMGFQKVMVTCDTDNRPSARIIEKNGGILSGHSISDQSGKNVSQYWILLIQG